MTDEQTIAYIKDLETRLSTIERYLTTQNIAWNVNVTIPLPARGASGALTSAETPTLDAIGYVVAKIEFSNIREDANVRSPFKQRILRHIDTALMEYDVYATKHDTQGDINPATGKPYVWYKLNSGYVREDVVTFSKDKPSPISVNAFWGIWDNPLDAYTVTNTHGVHNHSGIDLAAPIGTPVHCAPNGGFVSKVFHCVACGTDLENQARMGTSDPNTGYGLGNYVVMRYDPLFLPVGVKAIAGDKFLYCLYAHLSKIHVQQGTHIDGYAVIGDVGTSGNSTGAHLHMQCRYSELNTADFYSIRKNEIDPDLVFQIR